MRSINIRQICSALNLNYFGKNYYINSLYLYGRKTCYDHVLSYATNSDFIKKLQSLDFVKVIVVSKNDYDCLDLGKQSEIGCIVTDKPEETFYDIHDYLIQYTDFYKYELEKSTGEDCIISPTAIIDDNVQIGDHCVVEANAVVLAGTIIGDNVHVGYGTIVGADCLQMIKRNGRNTTIKHVGGVKIGNNTYIGNLCTVAKSLFDGFTEIGNSVMIDSHVHIAHNCEIEDNAVITAGVLMCGSSIIKKGAFIGVGSKINNKVIIGENSYVGMGSVIIKTLKPNSEIFPVVGKNKSQLEKETLLKIKIKHFLNDKN